MKKPVLAVVAAMLSVGVATETLVYVGTDTNDTPILTGVSNPSARSCSIHLNTASASKPNWVVISTEQPESARKASFHLSASQSVESPIFG